MLQKIFIKNYKNIEDKNVRSRYGILAGVFGIITNLFLCTIKIIIGIVSGSVTIIADGFNSMADILSSFFTWVGFLLSKRKADKKHPFGYARYEYITGIIIAYFIFLMGVFFLKESYEKIINPSTLVINNITYLVLFIAIIVKLMQMFVYLDLSKAIKSTTIKANFYDSRNDFICTTVVFISTFIMGIFHYNIDGIMGILVSLFIIYSSIELIKETTDPLLGEKATKEQVKFIKRKLLSNKDINGIHDLIIHNYGPTVTFATVHAEVDDKMSIVKAHDIMDDIEKKFEEKYNIFLTIHTDPINSNDKETNKLKREVKKVLRKLDKTLTIHDFKIVSSTSNIKVIFDIIVPFEKDYSKKYLTDYLEENFKDKNKTYTFILHLDRPYY